MNTALSAITLPHPGPCTPTAWPNFLMMGNDDYSYCTSLLRHHTNRHPGWLGHERRIDSTRWGARGPELFFTPSPTPGWAI